MRIDRAADHRNNQGAETNHVVTDATPHQHREHQAEQAEEKDLFAGHAVGAIGGFNAGIICAI